ncbi:MAG TPA: hypothetical protein PLB89_01040 [Flavobacteriales bacterium]|nr:hypothetical protein [Flavobacteriales bacterium]
MYYNTRLIMRAQQLFALSVIFSFVSSMFDHTPQRTAGTHPLDDPASLFDGWAGGQRDLLDFNILQHTCALYVALRSSAWEGPIAFGREMDDSMVHWNMCPGGTMVACTVTPSADGDTIITGIPWPYTPVAGH